MELPEEVRIFLVEAYENLDKVENELMELEKKPQEVSVMNSLFRAIHTIKGNSGFLGFNALETLCHRTEAVLDQARNGKLVIKGNVVTILLKTNDAIRSILQIIEKQGSDSGVNVELALKELSTIGG